MHKSSFATLSDIGSYAWSWVYSRETNYAIHSRVILSIFNDWKLIIMTSWFQFDGMNMKFNYHRRAFLLMSKHVRFGKGMICVLVFSHSKSWGYWHCTSRWCALFINRYTTVANGSIRRSNGWRLNHGPLGKCFPLRLHEP